MSIHKLNENMIIKTNNDKDNILKDDQDNIQARESLHPVGRYITMSLYM